MINRIAGYSSAEAKAESRQRPMVTSRDIKRLVAPVERLIADYPAAALAAAFVVGVALAWWIKQR